MKPIRSCRVSTSGQQTRGLSMIDVSSSPTTQSLQSLSWSVLECVLIKGFKWVREEISVHLNLKYDGHREFFSSYRCFGTIRWVASLYFHTNRVYKAWYYGFYINTPRNITIDSCQSIDSHVGIFTYVIGPSGNFVPIMILSHVGNVSS